MSWRGVQQASALAGVRANIFVKGNAPEVLSRTLRFGATGTLSWLEGETIVIGTATDPYQPAERRFRVTRGILEVIAEHPGLSVVIITKGPLITRDIDVSRGSIATQSFPSTCSLITLDRDLARRIEPRIAHAGVESARFGATAGSGIDAGINCMPVLPGITDNPSDLEGAGEAGV